LSYLPNLHDIKYFLTVADEKNISAAAKTLSISQPSLSLAIKRLEENLELNLLVRGKKGVELTKDGHQLYAKFKNFLTSWEEIIDSTQEKGKNLKGNFRFGVHQSIALYALSKTVKKLIDNYPELNLEFTHDHSKNINQKVIDCELDFGVVVNPLRHPDLTLVKLFEDKVKFWRAKKKNDHNDPKSDHLVMICDKNLMQTQSLVKSLSKSKFKQVKRYITSDNLEVVAELTVSGSGVGIIPERVTKKLFKNQLTEIKELPSFKDEMYFVYRRDFIHSEAFNTLKDIFLQELKSL
jgi:DNA-binding transcriptional LysR family regulator